MYMCYYIIAMGVLKPTYESCFLASGIDLSLCDHIIQVVEGINSIRPVSVDS